MKNEVNPNWKEAIRNQEVPYDPAAWKMLEARLDQVMPLAKPGKPWLKWAVASASVVTVGLGIYLFKQADRSTNLAPRVATQNVTSSATSDPQTLTEQAIPSERSAQRKVTSTRPLTAPDVYPEMDPVTAVTQPMTIVSDGTGEPDVMVRKIADVPVKFIQPIVSRTQLCVGDTWEVESQMSDLVLKHVESGRTWPIQRGNQVVTMRFAGSYVFVWKAETHPAAVVASAPQVDVQVDALFYEKGLPFNHVKALTSNIVQIEWKDENGTILSREKEFDFHGYRAGLHPITATVKDEQGCSVTVRKSVQVDANYNLLAVTGFNPEHPNPKNATFIPYALLERNTPFEMIIIDPKTGETVYKTSDVTQPWNGVDLRTNQLVKPGTTFIWKVKLFAPEYNETADYKGTITRM